MSTIRESLTITGYKGIGVNAVSRENHEWTLDGKPPILRDHSQAKHRVFKAYLERYVETLTKNLNMDRFRLTLVDGFSGGNLYLAQGSKEVLPGSPGIMLDAMKSAEQAAQLRRNKPFTLDVNYIFIDKSQNACDHLKKTLTQSIHQKLLIDKIQILNGDFLDYAGLIAKAVKDRGGRAIIFLDQCGYKDVPMSAAKEILTTLHKSEIILTFAVDFLLDYLRGDRHPSSLSQIGINISQDYIMSAKSDLEWRGLIQLVLHKEIHERSGAKYYTPFFIRSNDSHRDLWLIHLSNHSRARDVMVGLHWQEHTNFAHYGGPGLKMFGFVPGEDWPGSSQTALPGFHFDETARRLTHSALLDQLPNQIGDLGGSCTFDTLLSSITNGTPATSEIIKNAISELAKERDLLIHNSDFSSRKRIVIQHKSDIIILNKQKRLFFPK